MTIENNLAKYRLKRGLTAIELAKQIDISRQTIYAMETGAYMPNTLLALKLARVLDAKVEDLFRLKEAEAPARVETAELLPADQSAPPGLPVQLCEVDDRLVAVLPAPAAWSLPPADAVLVASAKKRSKAKVQLFQTENQFHLQSERYDLVLHERNLNHPSVQILLETLGRTSFRRELEGLGGYDTTIAGDRLV